jgi:hypothetical protein
MAPLFDWLMTTLSYQGIADSVATGFMRRHGTVHWPDIDQALRHRPTCPKLQTYWTFDDCGYRKARHICAEPAHIGTCPLPRHDLRNGRLNQIAYSLFLFMRDVASNDLVGWIDQQLAAAPLGSTTDPYHPTRWALTRPLMDIHGVSEKVASMALSMLLLGAGARRPLWASIGVTFVVVDTLVHNFLHRTGVLARHNAVHPYGPGCYRPGGCADILRAIAREIDARAFNPSFPQTFPRFIQHTIWRYCAQTGLDICNGNRMNDAGRCSNVHCRLWGHCDRIRLQKVQ